MQPWHKITIRILKILFPFGLAALVGFLLYQDLDVDGQRIIHHAISAPNSMVDGPGPDNRVSEVVEDSKERYWSVLIDPVYWTVTLPRQYDQIDVAIEYKAPNVPLVQFGGLFDADKWNFTWQGMQVSALDSLEWPCIVDQERGWYFCQKNKLYESIDAFLLDPPRYTSILSFNFPLDERFSSNTIDQFNHELDVREYDYIVADYIPSAVTSEWRTKHFSFPINSLDKQGNAVQFVLSAPGIDKRAEFVAIRSITFTLVKQPLTPQLLWQKVIQKIK